MNKLVLIDGNSIAFRAFYALPLLSNSSGLFTNAVYGFTMMLLKIIEDEKPSHIFVAFDAGKDTFRHKEYKDYKGGRTKTPPELSEQFPLIKEVLDAFGIHYFELDQYEADDILGTISSTHKEADGEIVIITGDKDLLQLIDEHVHVLMMRKGVTDAVRYDVQAVEDKYGLKPFQIIDLKGLMGDSSDNIPGIPGVGEKTALKLLGQYPSVEEVVANAYQIPGKLGVKVREHTEQALLSKRLATIFCEVPLQLGLDDFVYVEPDQQKLVGVFQQLDFKALLKRLQNVGETNEVKDVAPIAYETITSENQHHVLQVLRSHTVSIFVEATEENPHRSEVIGISLSYQQSHFYMPMKALLEWKEGREWLENPNFHKVTYDGKRTRTLLSLSGLGFSGEVFDILLAAYLLNPSESQLELSMVFDQYVDGALPSDDIVYGKGAKRRALYGEDLAEHLSRKSAAMYQLYPVLLEKLKEDQLLSLLVDLELPLSNTLSNMERQGIYIDRDRLDELGRELAKRLEELTEEIYGIAGSEFNINSPKQLGFILFEKLGLPPVKKTKTGYSTNAEVLEILASQHEIAEKIVHFRQVGKLLSTYVEGLSKEIHEDGKIHTQYNQTIASTGRLSSTEPNLQNIPIRLEEGRRIRQVFIPSERGWYIVAADYSQIELRVLAHLSGDENLQRAFRDEKDIHTQTAMDVFEVSEDEVTSDMRRQAKAVNFGIVYGMSDYGLSQNLGISRDEARRFIERYFNTYPGVKGYMEQIIKDAKQKGYVTTLVHRRRYLPDINSSNYNIRGFAERTAMNTPIQGTAADIIKYAMIRLERAMIRKQLKSKMLLQVHDELVFEVPRDELTVLKELVKQTMENALLLSVPLTVDISVGENWYQAK